MDIGSEENCLHIPQEVVDTICDSLAGQIAELCTLRLVCKAFYSRTTDRIQSSPKSPSELFTNSIADGTFDLINAFFGESRKDPPQLVTVWTEVEMDASIEEPLTDVGGDFGTFVTLPDQFAFSTTWAQGSTAVGGRKAVCWGRVVERPSVVWIIHQYMNEAQWEMYLDNLHARNLRSFIQTIAPGAIETSKSQRIPWPPRHRKRRPLFDGYVEVRTVYMAASMALEWRLRFGSIADKYCFSLNNAPGVKDLGSREWLRDYTSHRPASWGYSSWCWVPGLVMYEGKLAVAARFVFDWKDQENEERHYSSEKKDTLVGLPADMLDPAMVLGVTSEHCTFIRGPWNN